MAISTHIFDVAMQPLELAGFARMRRHVLSAVRGDVLEVGAGSGLNSVYYPSSAISSLTVTDRQADRAALARAFSRRPLADAQISIEDADLMALPFDGRRFDTIVCTLVLCSVPDVHRAAREMIRVLRPGGVILFMEHIQSSRPRVKPFLDTVTPAWRRIADGCHLNRNTPALLEEAGLKVHLDHIWFDGLLVSGYATVE